VNFKKPVFHEKKYFLQKAGASGRVLNLKLYFVLFGNILHMHIVVYNMKK